MTEFVFNDELRARLTRNLHAHEVRRHSLEGRRHAAVAIVVVDSNAEEHGQDPHPATAADMIVVPGRLVDGFSGSVAGTAGGPALLLTRRAATLRSHGGQWALPGGRVDHNESAPQAALRELVEEIGLTLGEDAVLGELDDYPTRSGYVMTPIVFWGGPNPSVTADPAEVRSVHRVSFRELCRRDSPRFLSIPESDRPVVQVPIGGDLIHAPTGAVMLQFRRVALEGVSERVDHLEQPVFAWR